MKKTPLRRVSKKRAVELRTYYSLKKYILSQRPYCERGTCLNRSTGIHHIRGRGKLLNVVKYWLAVCSDCHRWIHDHGREARKLGLLK